VRIRGSSFGFYSAEPAREPAHVHVNGKGGNAKLWLRPVRLVFSTYTRSETSDIVDVVHEQEDKFVEMWREHFGDR
jgi:hypothetical protein